MQKKVVFFTAVFFVTFAVVLFFLGSSITGYVTQTRYCDEKECRDFCRFNADCTGEADMCCNIKDMGVCTHYSECHNEFDFSLQPEYSLDLEPKEPFQEKPSYANPAHIGLFLITSVLIMVVAIVYYFNNYIL